MKQPKPPHGPPNAPDRWQTAWVVLGLGLLTLVTYANSFSAGLTLDNSVLIGQDPRLNGWSAENFTQIFTRTYWWPYLESDLFRPLTTLSYWANYTLLGNGTNVGGYHMVNWLLHWANACLVLVIVRRLTGRLALAALTAALFAVHPANTESVTNIVGRADLLATFSILFGGWCYLRAAAAVGGRKAAWLVGMGVSALLGVFTKESAAMILVFLVLYDWLWRWPAVPGRNLAARGRTAVWEFGVKGYLALVPAIATLAWVRHWVTASTPVFDQRFVDNPIAHPATWWGGFLTAMKVQGRYVELLIWPQTLSCDYSYNQIPLYGEGAGWWENAQAWLGLGLVAALLVAATRVRLRNPTLAWGVWLFFTMQLLTANVVMPIGSIMAERFLYLPAMGFSVVAALGLLWVGQWLGCRAGNWRAVVMWALPVLVVGGYALRSFARNADWRDELTLWKSAVAAAPNSFKTHKGYANALWSTGETEAALDAAIAEDEIARAILERTPLTPVRWDNTLYQDMGTYYRVKGVFLLQRGETAKAKENFDLGVAVLEKAREVDRWVNQAAREKALREGQAPDSIRDVGNHRVYLQLGLIALASGNMTEAAEAGRYMQRLAPQEAMGYRITGEAEYSLGHVQEGVRQILQSLVLDPHDPDLWVDLNHGFTAMGLTGAILQNGNGYSLNAANPVVIKVFEEAFLELAQRFAEAKRPEDVQKVHELAVKTYGLRAGIFTQPAK